MPHFLLLILISPPVVVSIHSLPLNTLSMLHDYIQPEQRWVACPNQDVVYGAAIAALDETPVVVQVPDFGDRLPTALMQTME